MAKIPLGGKGRIGSGDKMEVTMPGYSYSMQDLSYLFKTSACPGTLIPFLTEVLLATEEASIDLAQAVKTIPALGPLFGSFKLQMDIYKVPFRLYNARMHNDPLNVGRNIGTIMYPQMSVAAKNVAFSSSQDPLLEQIHPSSLLSYLGISGVGNDPTTGQKTVRRKFNAMVLLAYWDIFKNYYANKQEELAYVVQGIRKLGGPSVSAVVLQSAKANGRGRQLLRIALGNANDKAIPGMVKSILPGSYRQADVTVTAEGTGMVNWNDLRLTMGGTEYGFVDIMTSKGGTVITYNSTQCMVRGVDLRGFPGDATFSVVPTTQQTKIDQVNLFAFPLDNIDRARQDILTKPWDEQVLIADYAGADLNYYPYMGALGEYIDPDGNSVNQSVFPLAGLAVKTYNSDRFNNWVNSDWLEGPSGVAEMSKVAVSNGAVYLDAFNMAKSVYNLLNRVAIAGGSLSDYRTVVWGVGERTNEEVPQYVGGVSSEVAFDEVVATSRSETGDGTGPLGELGGRGYSTGFRGESKIHVSAGDEECMIIGLFSLTPRLDYSQGNRWFVNLNDMDDLHKPEFDGIGMQDLITDEIAAWDTRIFANSGIMEFRSAGKQVAWQEYRTNTNRVHGTFAERGKNMFMTLNRKYEPLYNTQGVTIKDLTTYIEPEKYNDVFADTGSVAENFWVQIAVKMHVKRKMSERVIPNL